MDQPLRGNTDHIPSHLVRRKLTARKSTHCSLSTITSRSSPNNVNVSICSPAPGQPTQSVFRTGGATPVSTPPIMPVATGFSSNRIVAPTGDTNGHLLSAELPVHASPNLEKHEQARKSMPSDQAGAGLADSQVSNATVLTSHSLVDTNQNKLTNQLFNRFASFDNISVKLSASNALPTISTHKTSLEPLPPVTPSQCARIGSLGSLSFHKRLPIVENSTAYLSKDATLVSANVAGSLFVPKQQRARKSFPRSQTTGKPEPTSSRLNLIQSPSSHSRSILRPRTASSVSDHYTVGEIGSHSNIELISGTSSNDGNSKRCSTSSASSVSVTPNTSPRIRNLTRSLASAPANLADELKVPVVEIQTSIKQCLFSENVKYVFCAAHNSSEHGDSQESCSRCVTDLLAKMDVVTMPTTAANSENIMKNNVTPQQSPTSSPCTCSLQTSVKRGRSGGAARSATMRGCPRCKIKSKPSGHDNVMKTADLQVAVTDGDVEMPPLLSPSKSQEGERESSQSPEMPILYPANADVSGASYLGTQSNNFISDEFGFARPQSGLSNRVSSDPSSDRSSLRSPLDGSDSSRTFSPTTPGENISPTRSRLHRKEAHFQGKYAYMVGKRVKDTDRLTSQPPPTLLPRIRIPFRLCVTRRLSRLRSWPRRRIGRQLSASQQLALTSANQSNHSGYPHVDIIDGIEFCSFESEEDLRIFMLQYPSRTLDIERELAVMAALESATVAAAASVKESEVGSDITTNPSVTQAEAIMTKIPVSDSPGQHERRNPGDPIRPTKTHDVTKIKGWRGKVFTKDTLPAAQICDDRRRLLEFPIWQSVDSSLYPDSSSPLDKEIDCLSDDSDDKPLQLLAEDVDPPLVHTPTPDFAHPPDYVSSDSSEPTTNISSDSDSKDGVFGIPLDGAGAGLEEVDGGGWFNDDAVDFPLVLSPTCAAPVEIVLEPEMQLPEPEVIVQKELDDAPSAKPSPTSKVTGNKSEVIVPKEVVAQKELDDAPSAKPSPTSKVTGNKSEVIVQKEVVAQKELDNAPSAKPSPTSKVTGNKSAFISDSLDAFLRSNLELRTSTLASTTDARTAKDGPAIDTKVVWPAADSCPIMILGPENPVPQVLPSVTSKVAPLKLTKLGAKKWGRLVTLKKRSTGESQGDDLDQRASVDRTIVPKQSSRESASHHQARTKHSTSLSLTVKRKLYNTPSISGGASKAHPATPESGIVPVTMTLTDAQFAVTALVSRLLWRNSFVLPTRQEIETFCRPAADNNPAQACIERSRACQEFSKIISPYMALISASAVVDPNKVGPDGCAVTSRSISDRAYGYRSTDEPCNMMEPAEVSMVTDDQDDTELFEADTSTWTIDDNFQMPSPLPDLPEGEEYYTQVDADAVDEYPPPPEVQYPGNTRCGQPFCLLGCLCVCLKVRRRKRKHCGKTLCMFACTCFGGLPDDDEESGGPSRSDKSGRSIGDDVGATGRMSGTAGGPQRKRRRQTRLPAKLQDSAYRYGDGQQVKMRKFVAVRGGPGGGGRGRRPSLWNSHQPSIPISSQAVCLPRPRGRPPLTGGRGRPPLHWPSSRSSSATANLMNDNDMFLEPIVGSSPPKIPISRSSNKWLQHSQAKVTFNDKQSSTTSSRTLGVNWQNNMRLYANRDGSMVPYVVVPINMGADESSSIARPSTPPRRVRGVRLENHKDVVTPKQKKNDNAHDEDADVGDDAIVREVVEELLVEVVFDQDFQRHLREMRSATSSSTRVVRRGDKDLHLPSILRRRGGGGAPSSELANDSDGSVASSSQANRSSRIVSTNEPAVTVASTSREIGPIVKLKHMPPPSVKRKQPSRVYPLPSGDSSSGNVRSSGKELEGTGLVQCPTPSTSAEVRLVSAAQTTCSSSTSNRKTSALGRDIAVPITRASLIKARALSVSTVQNSFSVTHGGKLLRQRAAWHESNSETAQAATALRTSQHLKKSKRGSYRLKKNKHESSGVGEDRRLQHNILEKKRRRDLHLGFKDLATVVAPIFKELPNPILEYGTQLFSKQGILDKSLKVVTHLKRTQCDLMAEKKAAIQDIKNKFDYYSTLLKELPQPQRTQELNNYFAKFKETIHGKNNSAEAAKMTAILSGLASLSKLQMFFDYITNLSAEDLQCPVKELSSSDDAADGYSSGDPSSATDSSSSSDHLLDGTSSSDSADCSITHPDAEEPPETAVLSAHSYCKPLPDSITVPASPSASVASSGEEAYVDVGVDRMESDHDDHHESGCDSPTEDDPEIGHNEYDSFAASVHCDSSLADPPTGRTKRYTSNALGGVSEPAKGFVSLAPGFQTSVTGETHWTIRRSAGNRQLPQLPVSTCQRYSSPGDSGMMTDSVVFDQSEASWVACETEVMSAHSPAVVCDDANADVGADQSVKERESISKQLGSSEPPQVDRLNVTGTDEDSNESVTNRQASLLMLLKRQSSNMSAGATPPAIGVVSMQDSLTPVMASMIKESPSVDVPTPVEKISSAMLPLAATPVMSYSMGSVPVKSLPVITMPVAAAAPVVGFIPVKSGSTFTIKGGQQLILVQSGGLKTSDATGRSVPQIKIVRRAPNIFASRATKLEDPSAIPSKMTATFPTVSVPAAPDLPDGAKLDLPAQSDMQLLPSLLPRTSDTQNSDRR